MSDERSYNGLIAAVALSTALETAQILGADISLALVFAPLYLYVGGVALVYALLLAVLLAKSRRAR